MLRSILFASVLVVAVAACTPTQQVYEVTEVDRPAEYLADSLVAEVESQRVRYILPERVTQDRAPARDYDLLETALDLRFDFEDEAVLGTVRHTLTPLRDSLARFYFNAETMEVRAVQQEVDGRAVGVGYDLDSTRITVAPRSPLRYGETYTFVIDYAAHPGRGAGPGGLGAGGEGLYFIDAAGTDPFRPTQIWTQGQAQGNRRWFPTWDYPNDRQTFDLTVTVPDSMRTAANGELVEQTALGEGLRRDRWVLGGDHPAYLTALAVGNWTTARDSVESIDGDVIPLEYLVEPRFADEVPAIFGETPDMMRFFETYLGVPYPWANYKQVAVRDFTAGGMENTTVTVLYEHVQTDADARLDYEARDLISHELAHQWFGDLVTTEDWANLTLNESFASYLEELYLEDAFGRDAAQAHSIKDRMGYFDQADTLRRPIVWFGYDTPDDVFDAHTYQKGAQVLNQLRFEIGDAAFRRGLTRYLTEYAYQTVELDDLRQVFEAVTGRSLHRFFDQWWRQPGHPVLDVEQAFFAGSGLYTVQVVQQQSRADAPVFHFDLNIEFNYPDRPREVRRVRVTEVDQTFRFDVPQRPSFVRVNEGYGTLAATTFRQPLAETLVQAIEDDELAGRYDAVGTLAGRELNAEVREVLLRVATDDPHPLVRKHAVEALAKYARIASVQEALRALGREDAEAEVRRAALTTLAPADTSAATGAVLRAALADPSGQTRAKAVELYAAHAPSEAFEAFRPLLDVTSYRGRVEAALSDAIGRHRIGGDAGTRFLAEHAGLMNPTNVRLASVQGLLVWSRRDDDVQRFATETLNRLVAGGTPAIRVAVAGALAEIGDADSLAAIETQLDVERDEAARTALTAAAEQIRKGTTQVGG